MNNLWLSSIFAIVALGIGINAIRILFLRRRQNEIKEKIEVTDKPKKLPKWAKRLIYFFSIIFCLIGIGGVVTGYFEINGANETLNWSSTTGEVIESKIVTDRSGGQIRKRGLVLTHYSVNDKDYETYAVNTLGYFRAGTGIDHVKKYPKGKKVKVYYNPNKPSQALLERGNAIKNNGKGAISVGIVFLIMGFLGIQVGRGKLIIS